MSKETFRQIFVRLVVSLLLVNRLNVVDGEQAPLSALCVEPHAPFNEHPTAPEIGGGTIEPWYQPTPTKPLPPQSVIEPWNQPIHPTPPPPCKNDNPINAKYDTKSPGGELAIKFSYDEEIDQGKMNVMISYETETAPAAKFFKEQFTDELVQGFSKCGVIEWDIVPCSISKMKNGQLFCPQGAKQCEFDKIHACAENIYKDDPQKMALFVICFFTQGNNAQECTTKNGMVYDKIWQCASGEHGTDLCEVCHSHSRDKGSKNKIPNEPPNPVGPVNPGGDATDPVDPGFTIQPVADVNYPEQNTGIPGTHDLDVVATPGVANPIPHDDPSSPGAGGNSNLNGITDFKGALCAKLGEGKLKCDFCSC